MTIPPHFNSLSCDAPHDVWFPGETPESEEMRSVLASARSRTEMFPSLAGKRVVSETEWSKLQEEVTVIVEF